MFPVRSLFAPTLFFSALSLLPACSDAQQSPAPATPKEAPVVQVEAAAEPAVAAAEPAVAAAEPSASAEEEDEIDPDSLESAGQIELKQYTVAWVGSGTVGGGTLTIDTESHPFRIVGLGLGGFGASAVEATGVVYNLPSLDAFPGTYGNARLGMTAGDSGGGKLWLRNADGVVIELDSEMRGLALAAGVDGLVIQWEEEDEEESNVDRAMDNTQEVVGKGVEAGADTVEKGIGKIKGWMKTDDD